jgi:tripartite ATP-independent transporter DctM subunit
MAQTPFLKKLEDFSLVLTRHINTIGVVCLAAMMMATSADVFLRFLFDAPIPGSIEISSYLLLLTILCGVPYAAAQKMHIAIDILTCRMKPKRLAGLESITLLLVFAVVVLMVWQGIDYASLQFNMNRTTAILQLPVWPFVLVVAVAGAVLALVIGIELVKTWRASSGGPVRDLTKGAAAFMLLAALALTAFYFGDLDWYLSPVAAGVWGMALLFLCFLAGMPIYASLLLIGFLGMSYLRGYPAGLSVMGSSPFTTASHYTFTVIPLFVLMGEFCFFSGLGSDLYTMAYRWVGHLPGGLAMGTVGGCGGFAAVCGDSMATAVTMGTVALPEMKRFKYSDSLAVGCVAAGGTLGVLIPPSLAFILYALLTDQSIATLFISGIVPGVLLVGLFMLLIFFMAKRDPKLAPPGPRTSMAEKIEAIKNVWATLALFVLVIGGMYAGVFTPTEGGGVGAFGALLIGVLRRRLYWGSVISALLEAGKISAVCVSILIGAEVFGYFLAASKLPLELANYVATLAVPGLLILILILIIYLFLGCLMPAIPMLVLTVPIFFPVISALGFDPIWYGVIMVLMFEMAVITPPMGINVLALRSVASEVPLSVMFKGTMPFLLALALLHSALDSFSGNRPDSAPVNVRLKNGLMPDAVA